MKKKKNIFWGIGFIFIALCAVLFYSKKVQTPQVLNEIYSLERSEGIEKELKELKAEQSKDTDNNKPVSVETETGDDEYVISFVDKKFRKEIIEITGISGRDITYGDVKNIEKLSYM